MVFHHSIVKLISLLNAIALYIRNVSSPQPSLIRGARGERILPRVGSRNRLLSVLPMPIVGAFMAGLCLSLFAACTASNTANTSATSTNNPTSAKASVVRFGYQKSAILLKAKGVLEKRLKPEGISVEWIEFPAGPQLLEAMNAGSIDFGHAGESPPIFTQARLLILSIG